LPLSHVSLGKYLNKLLGIDGALKRLDTLTQEESRMAIAEVLKVTHMMDDKFRLIIDGAQNAVSLMHVILNYFVP
jgi:3-dehydroquinate synthetase